jgi:allophanate hydrolase
VPRPEQLAFFGSASGPRLFGQAAELLGRLGGEPAEVDLAPFLEAARLLYEGPWVAERYAAIRDLIEPRPEALHPVTRKIIEPGAAVTAVQAFQAQHRLQALKRRSDVILGTVDFVATPTAGTIYLLEEVEADPLRLNANLGYYTNS